MSGHVWRDFVALMNRSPGALISGMGVGWAVVAWIGQSWNFIYADDALPFVVRIHQGAVHPHHLIVGVLGMLNHWLGWVRPEDFRSTLEMVRAFVVGMSSLGLAGVGYLAWLWFRRHRAVMAAMVLTAVSYGFWAYSIVPDFYVPGIAAILWAAIALERYQQSEKGRWIAIAIGAIFVAALCHQSYAVYAVIATGVLLLNNRPRAALQLLTSCTILLVVSYTVAFSLQQEYQNFWRFVLGYTPHMQFTPYDRLQILTPLYALVGVARAWTFPEYLVRVEAIGEWVEQHWPMKLFLDERFLLRNMSEAVAGVLGSVGLVGAGLVVFLLILRVQWVHKQLFPRWSYWSLLGWAGSLLVLAVVWEPSSNEFWLWCLPLVALGLSEARSLWERRVWVTAVVALAVATIPVIWLYHWPDNDIYSVNKRYRLRLHPEDVVIAGDFQQTLALNWLYPTRARVLQYELGRIQWDSVLQDALHRLARPSSQGRLVLDPLIVMPHRSEIALRQKLPGWSEERITALLQQIVDFCRGGEAEVRERVHDRIGEHWMAHRQSEILREGTGRSSAHHGWEEQEYKQHLGVQERRRIPVVGIRREGGGIVHFIERRLPGLEWTGQ